MIEQNTQVHKKFKILLIGDICDDIYQYGIVERISPEAPVPIFKPTHSTGRLGMAGNVYHNLVALGCDVTLKTGEHSKKTRFIDSRSKQQVLRLDEDVQSVPLLVNKSTFDGYDAVVVADYGKGTVTYELVEHAILSKLPVFVDTKKTDLERMQGAWVKINEAEYSKIKSDCTGLIVTKGANGAEAKWHEFTAPAVDVEVTDVTGAGDTFLAALAYMYLQTQNIKLAIEFANRASAVTVQHLGCYAPTLKEIDEKS